MKVLAIAINTGREAIRNKVLYTILLFACLLTAIAGAIGSVSMGDHIKFIKDFSLFSVSLFGLVTTAVLGVNLLGKELEKRTIYNLLSKPVARWQFLVGKFFGMWAVLIVMIGIMTVALYGFLFAIEGRFDWSLLPVLGAMILELGMLLAVAIFFSSIVVTPALSGLFTVGAFIAGRSVPWLSHFSASDQPPAMQTLAAILYAVLPHLHLYWLADRVIGGEVIELGYYIDLLVYTAAYCTILLLLSIIVFRRREFL